MRWLILLVTMPPTPSRNRVGIWRKLRRMGAVSIKGAAWMLPENPDTVELMHWLMQEVQTLKGDAALLRSDTVEMLPERDPAALFHEARTQDYAAVEQQCETLLAELSHPLAGRRGAAGGARSRLTKLKRELDDVARIDYMRTSAGERARAAYEAAAAKLHTLETPMKPRKSAAKSTMPPTGSTWVTRPRPHIDRIASAWLITRFHDKGAKFAFAEKPAERKGAIPFDTLGAEFGHHGEDCTFETLLKRIGSKDRKLRRLAELVHEADLRDGKYPGEEAAGIDFSIKGLAAALPDDHELLRAGMTLFDGLYATLTATGSRKE